jgi:hypothetical protein
MIRPLAFIVLFFLYVWLAIKIVHRSLDMITEIPSGIMKWVGGGHDPLDPGIGQQGSSFIGGVMNKGEGAAQAGAGAAKGIQSGKDAEKKAQATEAAANQRNQDLISAFNNGGGNKGGGTQGQSRE